MWSELYAGLTPFKVLIGLTGSYAAAPVLVFLLNGLYPAYQGERRPARGITKAKAASMTRSNSR